MTPSPNYYAIIPAPVLNHSELSPSAKLFYAQITGLLGQGGYCWASNEYFAERNGVSKWSIGNWVAQLTEAGFLVVKYGKDTDYQRRIYLSETLPPMRKTLHPTRKTQRPPLEKSNTPHEKNPMPPIGKIQHRVIKESNKSEVVKVSGGNALANPNQPSEIQGQGDTSMPSMGGAARPTTFAESVWANESPEAWRVALVAEANIPDLDAAWYFNRVKDWSAEKTSTSANWVVTAAKFARDDQRKQKLVTLQPITDHDQPSHSNPRPNQPKPAFRLSTTPEDVRNVVEAAIAARSRRYGVGTPRS